MTGAGSCLGMSAISSVSIGMEIIHGFWRQDYPGHSQGEAMIGYKLIGTIYTPFKKREGTPIQSAGAVGMKGTV